ncbi:MAG TPA: hypothetical protein DDW36_04270 [Candidatus Magasanikbacteria bacterium]|nr:hypothetical protein [Candidatus Magasanikbacteria bacterium]
MAKIIKKEIQRYTAVFEEDKGVGGYTVSIPSLPGCISEGDTFEEAQANIQEAASLYVSVMRKKKVSVPKEEAIIVAPVLVAV